MRRGKRRMRKLIISTCDVAQSGESPPIAVPIKGSKQKN